MTFWIRQGNARKTEVDDRSVARKRREKRERQKSARASAEPWAEAEAVRRNKQVISKFCTGNSLYLIHKDRTSY